MKKLRNKNGFTLVEIIVVLLLMGIVAVVLCNVIVYSMHAYIFARNADQLSQKAQLALARMKIELTDISEVSTATTTQITYTVPKSAAPPSCATATGCQYTILLSDTQITLEDVTNSAGTKRVLIDGLTANNNGNTFLTYYQTDGTTPWTTTDGFPTLGKVQIILFLDNETGSGVTPVKYEGSINPRANSLLNAPSPN